MTSPVPVSRDAPSGTRRALLGALVLAAALVVWARVTEARVELPGYRVPWLGAVLVSAGLGLATGVGRLTRHPVHIGFVVVTFGVALITGSSSGLWLVGPVTALAAAAAHRRTHLRLESGDANGAVEPPFLRLPPDDASVPTARDRLSVFVLVFVPWTVAYEAAFLVGIPPDAVLASFPFERDWPVLVWTEAIYVSVYFIVLAATFGARENRVLRHLSVTALIATVVVPLIYVTVPVISPPRPFVSDSVLGAMLEMERAMSHTVAAFPAFHVIWTLIAAEALAATAPRLKGPTYIWAAAVSVSCITTGMHSLIDVVFAVAVFAVLRSYRPIRRGLRRALKTAAAAGRQGRVGTARLGAHQVWTGVAVATGAWTTMALGGPASRPMVGVALAVGLITAAWTGHRHRYLAILAGVGSGAVAATLAGMPVLLLPTAVAVAAPWMRAMAYPARVTARGAEGEVSVRLLPLFASLVIGTLLARLWKLGAAMSLILGLYLILGGLARYAAGPRRRPWAGLLAAGVVVTCLPGGPAPDASGWLLPGTLAAASASGLLAAWVVGRDVRDRTRREAQARSA